METVEGQSAIWVVKVRNRTDKPNRFAWFLSGRGGMNRLRVHAAQFTDAAAASAVVAEINANNPDVEAKAVKS